MLLLSLVPLSAAFYPPPGVCCPTSLFFYTPLTPLAALLSCPLRWHFAIQFPVTGLKGLKLERRQICKQAAMRRKCLTQVSFKSSTAWLRKQPWFLIAPINTAWNFPYFLSFRAIIQYRHLDTLLGKSRKKKIRFKLIYPGFLLRGNAAANWKNLIW